MKRSSIIYPLLAFVAACMLGLVVTFFGLRLYYGDARLQNELTRSYTANDFLVLAGQGSVDGGTLLVDGLQPDGFSFVRLDSLHIDSRFYQQLSLSFAEKHANQPLLLAVKTSDRERPVERPVLYTNAMTSSFLLDKLVDAGEVVSDVALITDRLISPYRIKAIKFIPKKLDNTTFAQLLISCFSVNKHWKNWSINTHKSSYQVLIAPKMLLLIYFAVVGLLFVIYLRLTRRPLINAWWATLVAAWFALDAHYLVEKTVITKNTYDTFANLSDDEKDLLLSPKAANIAQTIKSVLPDDAKRKKIRIQFGWSIGKGDYNTSENRYLSGKLYYFLQPNLVYALWRQIPLKDWQSGNFYYVEASPNRLPYAAEQSQLTIKSGQKISATLLLDKQDLRIYHILGDSGVAGEKK